MNSGRDTWYDELYRIFSTKQLLTVAQTIKLGECMRAIKAGENAQYHLNELLMSLGKNKDLYEQLEDYIRAYVKSQVEAQNEAETIDDDVISESEDGNYEKSTSFGVCRY